MSVLPEIPSLKLGRQSALCPVACSIASFRYLMLASGSRSMMMSGSNPEKEQVTCLEVSAGHNDDGDDGIRVGEE